MGTFYRFFFWEVTNPLLPPNFCVVVEMEIIHVIIHLMFFYKQNMKVKTSFKNFKKIFFFKIKNI